MEPPPHYSNIHVDGGNHVEKTSSKQTSRGLNASPCEMQELVVSQPVEIQVVRHTVVTPTYRAPESYAMQLGLSCFVIWCCLWPIGLVAFVLAMKASSKSPTNPEKARGYGKASLVCSIAGIIGGIVLLATLAIRTFGTS